jgi:kynureninase
VAGVAAQRGMTVREVDAHADEGLEPGVLAAALDERVAVVVLSQVAYRSARPARSWSGTSATAPGRCPPT